jgi:hypothetical protein
MFGSIKVSSIRDDPIREVIGGRRSRIADAA